MARRWLVFLGISLALGSSTKVASAEVGFTLHAEGAAAHAIGDRSNQFGWGAVGAIAPELRLHPAVGIELLGGVVGLSESAHQDPMYARSEASYALFAAPGVRVRPLAALARPWSDALWLAIGGGVADTSGIACPLVNARVGVDLHLGSFALGPAFGFMQVFDPHVAPLRHDASVAFVGLHARWDKPPPLPLAIPQPVQPDAPADHDEQADAEETCPEGPPHADPCQVPEPAPVVLFHATAERILFAYDSAFIEPEGVAALRTIAGMLAEHPEYERVEIDGHADDRGTDYYNLRLSAARASSVRDMLVRLGVDERRLVVAYFGKRRPTTWRRSERARRQNRRVEFILGKASSTSHLAAPDSARSRTSASLDRPPRADARASATLSQAGKEAGR